MSERTLIMAHDTNTARIYDETYESGDITRTYTLFYNITNIKSKVPGWYDLYNEKELVGFVSGITEVKEIAE